jgi:hypothetical protein
VAVADPLRKEPQLRVEGSGNAWAIFKGDELVRITAHHDRALDQIETLLRRNRMSSRPCLNCGKRFTSEGPHNRLCRGCRKG